VRALSGNNPSRTKLGFLVAEHSAGRIWSGGILCFTLWYVPFCCVLSYKDHLRMMLQHGLCFGSFCCVGFALLSFLFLLDTHLSVLGCDLIWASISATFHVF
jgi:hypothetical protein